MTEVAYGHFVDAVEDATLPLTESNQQEIQSVSKKDWAMMNIAVIRQFFRAMETVNNGQLDISESSLSMSTSGNSLSTASLNSLSSPRRQISPSVLTPQAVFGACQTLNGCASTNSLASMCETDMDEPIHPSLIPEILRKMVFVFDEFMHNHSYVEEDGNREKEFPKFC
jgi:hypothetical protein